VIGAKVTERQGNFVAKNPKSGVEQGLPPYIWAAGIIVFVLITLYAFSN